MGDARECLMIQIETSCAVENELFEIEPEWLSAVGVLEPAVAIDDEDDEDFVDDDDEFEWDDDEDSDDDEEFEDDDLDFEDDEGEFEVDDDDDED